MGETAGMSLLLKTNVQPSTSPSLTSTEGPVIAAVQVVAPDAAWKYPQYLYPVAECDGESENIELAKSAIAMMV